MVRDAALIDVKIAALHDGMIRDAAAGDVKHAAPHDGIVHGTVAGEVKRTVAEDGFGHAASVGDGNPAVHDCATGQNGVFHLERAAVGRTPDICVRCYGEIDTGALRRHDVVGKGSAGDEKLAIFADCDAVRDAAAEGESAVFNGGPAHDTAIEDSELASIKKRIVCDAAAVDIERAVSDHRDVCRGRAGVDGRGCRRQFQPGDRVRNERNVRVVIHRNISAVFDNVFCDAAAGDAERAA